MNLSEAFNQAPNEFDAWDIGRPLCGLGKQHGSGFSFAKPLQRSFLGATNVLDTTDVVALKHRMNSMLRISVVRYADWESNMVQDFPLLNLFKEDF